MAKVLKYLRTHNKSELIELVTMHLSFLIDVSTEEWDRIVYYVKKEAEEAEKDNPSKLKYFTSSASAVSSTSSDSTHSQKAKFGPPKQKELASNIFGNPLTLDSLGQAMILVNFLNEEENYKIEGIFRKSGTQERQQDLRYMLNNGVKVDLKANRFTPVDVSCVLKEYIQKLPEPLLTNNHFELYFALASTIKNDTPTEELEAKNAKRLKIIQLLLHLLPELNRKLFMSLMALLNKVAKSLEVTRMDERSLATIFGQHVLCPRTWTPKQMQKNIEIITEAMEFLLINNDQLFNGPDVLVADATIRVNKLLKQKNLLQQQQEQQLQSNRTGSGDNVDSDQGGDENDTVVRFCAPRQDTTTEQSVAELYAQVQAMPETPQKRKYIKRFNKLNGSGTPMHVTSKHSSSTSSKWKNLLPPILRPKH